MLKQTGYATSICSTIWFLSLSVCLLSVTLISFTMYPKFDPCNLLRIKLNVQWTRSLKPLYAWNCSRANSTGWWTLFTRQWSVPSWLPLCWNEHRFLIRFLNCWITLTFLYTLENWMDICILEEAFQVQVRFPCSFQCIFHHCFLKIQQVLYRNEGKKCLLVIWSSS